MTPEQIHQFFSFLSEGRIGPIAFWLKILAGLITSALVAAIVVIGMKLRQLIGRAAVAKPAPSSVLSARDLIAAPWQEVERKLESASPADWNLAVIQADSIFDTVLKDMGLLGATLGERLKQLDTSKLHTLNEVWEAHKIRNRIVHETDPVLNVEEARYAVNLFAKALGELQYLQE